MRDHPTEDDLKLIRWSDEQLDGKGYVTGMRSSTISSGGRARRVGSDVRVGERPAAVPRARDRAALGARNLAAARVAAARDPVAGGGGAGGGVVARPARGTNTGWLPTSVSERRSSARRCGRSRRRSRCRRARVHGGEKKVELGQLDGRVPPVPALVGVHDATSDRAKVEWVVEAPAGSVVQVEARHQRAGIVRRELTLE